MKPRLVVSKCIEFEHCRWNGMIISSDVVKLLRPHVDFVPVCPEVEIGLGVPREPIRIALRDGQPHLLQPATGADLTEPMREFARSYLDALPPADGFILKTRSPSCGPKDVRVYPESEQGRPSSKGRGFFAQEVLARYGAAAVEDEGRLTNYVIRDHFMTRVFTLAAFGDLASSPSMGGLVDFHARAKLLLQAHNEVEMRALGRIVANHGHYPTDVVFAEYRDHLSQALARPARRGATKNVLMHALGHFSEDLSGSEKDYFLTTLDDYGEGQVPLSVPIAILRVWLARYDKEYLRSQLLFAPYPEELVQVTDSGKGRDLK